MNAMEPPEASMHYSEGALSENSEITVDIVIPDNWHVNANVAADEFLKPSSIEIAARGIEFGEPKWPEPIKEYNEVLEFENLVFKGHFQIKIPVKAVTDGYDSLTTNATFHYQACDNSICLAPASVDIRIGKNKAGISKANSAADLKKNDEGNGTQESNNAASVALLLFFAFVGGIILNLMPCVLPVLSLKLFSLIKQAGQSRSRLVALGIATTAGILASFWTLAGIVAAIKAGGGAAGWGMQFQSAGFIAFMVVILTAFAMSFFGVFEVWLPGSATTKMDAAGHKAGLVGAFFTGALLVLLSTPCSAPFLGTAMGFAFTASTPVLFLFFTAAGLGLALPYLLVSAFPATLKVLPKPGKWMVTLQKAMGILLIATVAWLLWIVNEQAGGRGVALFVGFILGTVVVSFAIGKFAPPGSSFAKEVRLLIVCALAFAFAWFAYIAPQYEKVLDERFNARMAQQVLEDGWYRYTPELVSEFAKAGKTVFIDVSADWCLTCKANEAAVLSDPALLQKLDSAGVVRMKADWTRETPEVNELLYSMGKSGVPAYAIYPKGDKSKQVVLPELLTSGLILEAIP
ncbi:MULTISPECIES: thioredoxin family protein [unclassified Fibrobacter]|uniref:protein-disulfide reductase DsbD family protein n=1 Tax=unclassified Fibrobacter TaxID=2634177 RepID=UPI0025B96601|nr:MULTISPECIES: thioredoxin family protein [unclassified Fibrobacter]